jgi:type II secretory ATPase GspE/PulE/Tfp pilus assembly ATPase PilB-like protein
MGRKTDKTLYEALIKNNVLAEQDAQRYLLEAQKIKQGFKDYLLQRDLVTEKQILICLSQTSGFETVDIRRQEIDPAIIEKVPVKIASYYRFIPLQIHHQIMTVAVAFPLDVKIQDEIRMHVGFQIHPVLVQETDLAAAFKKYYGFASLTIDKILTQDPQKRAVVADDSTSWIEDIEKQTENPTVSNLVNQIILEAYKMRATDIHIEPYRDKVRFRYRIDGVLVDASLPDEAKHFLPAILSRIKILANLSITEKRMPQDGSAVVKTKEQHLDLRVSTIPTPRGESIVIRILPTKVMLFSLEKLGFNSEGVNQFRELIKKPYGIIFITGPTGSGKTTTLYACLNELNASSRKIITIEDPVEYEMEGITQVQVNQKVNFDFSTGLRSLLRHDPDIIMVGEVRDVETAKIAIRTALTGHLVFSTLHTNDAASGVTRLIDMGVEPYLVASSVEAFVAQRLVRIICPKCKQESTKDTSAIKKEISSSLKLSNIDGIKIYEGKGCDHCNNTGYYGRIAIYEIMIMNDSIRQAILTKSRSDYIKSIALREGVTTLRQNGWKAVLEGITTPAEVLNVSVKDEEVTDQKEDIFAGGFLTAAGSLLDVNASRMMSLGSMTTRRHYDSRLYPRIFESVEFVYSYFSQAVNLPGKGKEFSTFTQDLSAGGLSFFSQEQIPLGSVLSIRFNLSSPQRLIECRGKVCRIAEEGQEQIYSIAVDFVDIAITDRVAIHKLVEKKLSQGAIIQP